MLVQQLKQPQPYFIFAWKAPSPLLNKTQTQWLRFFSSWEIEPQTVLQNITSPSFRQTLSHFCTQSWFRLLLFVPLLLQLRLSGQSGGSAVPEDFIYFLHRNIREIDPKRHDPAQSLSKKKQVFNFQEFYILSKWAVVAFWTDKIVSDSNFFSSKAKSRPKNMNLFAFLLCTSTKLPQFH